MNKKTTSRLERIERFADGSSLETLGVLLREGGLAKASALKSGVGSEAASPAMGISYDDPPPQKRETGQTGDWFGSTTVSVETAGATRAGEKLNP